MYKQCKQYLIDCLRAAGLKTNPYTSFKALEKCQESHVGAVLFESETYIRNGSKTLFKDKEGARKKRRLVYERQLVFNVTIGGYSDDEAEELVDRFVAGLEDGIYIDGNYTTISIEGADWVDRDDSILRSKVAAQLTVRFTGGVYRDTGFAPLSGAEVASIGKELNHAKDNSAGA